MARQVAHTPTDFFAPPPPMIIEEDGKDKKTKKQRKRHSFGYANRNTNKKKNTRQKTQDIIAHGLQNNKTISTYNHNHQPVDHPFVVYLVL